MSDKLIFDLFNPFDWKRMIYGLHISHAASGISDKCSLLVKRKLSQFEVLKSTERFPECYQTTISNLKCLVQGCDINSNYIAP